LRTMDTLESMKVFARVAQRPGFAAAARDLRMSPAAVTKHVAALETRVGARLFDRTTRKVRLTEAGRVYLERCLACLQAVEDAEASVHDLSSTPRGLLRVTAPADLEREFTRVVARFMAAHSNVVVDLRLTNRQTDLVDEGIDVAVRMAGPLEGQYVARPLACLHVGVFASPAYLERHGRPRKPADLADHRSLLFVEPKLRDEWLFERDGKEVRVRLNGVMLTNSGDALRIAAVEGVGLFPGPAFLVSDEVEAGRIEAVLPEWRILPEIRMYAVYPHRRFVSPNVRAFVDLLRETYGDGTTDPWWRPERHPNRKGAPRPTA
jgi:DNA-binding transcriptional LysR family regulator